ncbi:MAG: beta galactosidase jelly roll domain-containing protein [Chitinophagaceae bacterium]|nr:beta galactosidase jelly roll domain-containing protein [Chitinophagaceae bacterium]
MFYSKKLFLLLVSCFVTVNVFAIVRLPVIFQSNMVLQRDKEVTIWGFADAGEKVEVNFKGQLLKSVAGKNSKWSIKLPATTAGGPYDITVKGKADTVELHNILFGDVWICGGQSNMQYTLDQIGYLPADTAAARNPKLRIFTASIDMDYVPKDDLSGGTWNEVSAEAIKYFSATAYFFGKFLNDSLQVPIGLISDNLGATAIETWMSPEALSTIPQFDNFHKTYLAPAKSFKEITAAFEKIKPEWQTRYYLKGQGIEQKWYLPETNVSDWKTMEIPGWWEDKGMADFDGAVWFRKTFDLPQNFKGAALPLALNQIDDYDIVWVNGQKVGEGYGNQNWRNYSVPANVLKPTDNVIVVRVFDAGGKGGMYSNAIWGNPILLGQWLYKVDNKIDAATFPRPHVVNVSPFTTPAVLYNANIAPLTSLAVKGFIWYQGEANAPRASEYRALFPAFINDWRKQFKQGDLPFLFVQLANYMNEAATPQESDWAELRDAQSAALKLPNTGMATIIDIGEANDIHPKNKMDVGKRLGLAALGVAYNKHIVSKGPTYESFEIKDGAVIIHFATGTDNLVTKDKYGYVRGFTVAGSDNKFYWAKASIENNTVILTCKEVSKPVSVRYAWSDNPGVIDLYNEAGLPAVPFRTDSLPLKTEGKRFSEDPWVF